MKTYYLLAASEQKDAKAGEKLGAYRQFLRSKFGIQDVTVCLWLKNKALLQDSVEKCLADGAEEIVFCPVTEFSTDEKLNIFPLFFADLKMKYPNLNFHWAGAAFTGKPSKKKGVCL